MYSTDNGAEVMSWPDGGTIPFRGEKNTTWEGGFRVPMMVRWPGTIPGGRVSNEIIEMTDWLPTLLVDTAAVTAMLDRLLHHGHILKCGPRSWRSRENKALKRPQPMRYSLYTYPGRSPYGRF